MKDKNIGEIITRKRKEKKMTQRMLAQELQVTDRAISNWETNKNLPDIEMFAKLSEILEYDFVSLIYGKDQRNKSTLFACVLFIIILIIIGMVYFYFVDNKKYYPIYFISSENLDLGNSYLILSSSAFILELDKISIEEATVTDFTIYTNINNERKDIITKNDVDNLTLIDNSINPKYLKKDVIKNLDKIFLEVIYQVDGETKSNTFNLCFTDSIDKNNYTKILLKNNGYQEEDKDIYVKTNQNLKLSFDLNRNVYTYLEIDNEIIYKISYNINKDLIYGNNYYNDQTMIMDWSYNYKNKQIECHLGDCSSVHDLYSKLKKEYNKVTNSSLP